MSSCKSGRGRFLCLNPAAFPWLFPACSPLSRLTVFTSRMLLGKEIDTPFQRLFSTYKTQELYTIYKGPKRNAECSCLHTVNFWLSALKYHVFNSKQTSKHVKMWFPFMAWILIHTCKVILFWYLFVCLFLFCMFHLNIQRVFHPLTTSPHPALLGVLRITPPIPIPNPNHQQWTLRTIHNRNLKLRGITVAYELVAVGELLASFITEVRGSHTNSP